MPQILEFSKFCLACFGSAAIVNVSVRGTVMDRKPFSCALCMGFWSAVCFLLCRQFMSAAWYEATILVHAAAGTTYWINKKVTGEY